MSSGNEILYIKGEKNTEVKEPNVTLGDILTMECSNSSIMNRIKPLRILKIPKKEQHRYVVSVLKIIECIHREIPGLQIQNEGESDLIITYEGEKKRNAIWQGIKVVVVAGITFIGAAFSIMAFNNDVSVTKMFSRIYLLLTGEESNGFTLIELTYCIGLIVGILIFFNHSPVEPGNLIVLAVAVVVAILRVAEFISGEEHRRAAAAHEHGTGVPDHPVAEL